MAQTDDKVVHFAHQLTEYPPVEEIKLRSFRADPSRPSALIIESSSGINLRLSKIHGQMLIDTKHSHAKISYGQMAQEKLGRASHLVVKRGHDYDCKISCEKVPHLNEFADFYVKNVFSEPRVMRKLILLTEKAKCKDD